MDFKDPIKIDWALFRLGDLSRAPFCPPCEIGTCMEDGSCSANYPFDDDRYARCGHFEELNLALIARNVGHGLSLRTRQPTIVGDVVLKMGGGNCLVGWIMGIGSDWRGDFFELERADLIGGSGWSLSVIPEEAGQTTKYYMGAVLGVEVVEKTRDQALLDATG